MGSTGSSVIRCRSVEPVRLTGTGGTMLVGDDPEEPDGADADFDA